MNEHSTRWRPANVSRGADFQAKVQSLAVFHV